MRGGSGCCSGYSRLSCCCKKGNQMELELIFKIAAVGIIVAVLVQLLKRAERDEQAMMTTIAGLIVVLMMIIQRISELFDTVKTLFGF